MSVDLPWLSTQKLTKINHLPDLGYRVPFDQKIDQKCKQFMLPHWRQIPMYITFSIRYVYTWLKCWWYGKSLFIDSLSLAPWEPIYGAPIGGIGSGSIGRGFKGEFCRFQLFPGFFERVTAPGDQFIVTIRQGSRTIYQKVLSPNFVPNNSKFESWDFDFPAEDGVYHALYPRAWYVYRIKELGIILTCRQISPFIPHDYKNSSLPCGLFVWSIDLDKDGGVDNYYVTISFMFQNSSGGPEMRKQLESALTETFLFEDEKGSSRGVAVHETCVDYKYSLLLSAKCQEGVEVNTKRQYNIEEGEAESVWDELFDTGKFAPEQYGIDDAEDLEIGFGVSCSSVIKAGVTTEFEFCLTWYMPEFVFKGKQNVYERWYTKFFSGNKAAELMSHYALFQRKDWERCIAEWQDSILNDESLPSFYKSALFNELYFLSDGGSVWIVPPERERDVPDVTTEFGRFAYLEGQEYRMYNTYDVHHYASFALLQLFPKLQLSLQYDIERMIGKEQDDNVLFLFDGTRGKSKVAGSVPHDIGDPGNEPWVALNTYTIHPTDEWRDLNIKFVLQVGRDYACTRDPFYLEKMYPAVKGLMLRCLEWDKDGDGIIENGGFPDQTYDAWVMTDVSAYCGGMWLAAIKIMVYLSTEFNHAEDRIFFDQLLNKASLKFDEILWNGSYYNFDSSNSEHHDSVMADQLAGHWFLRASNIQDYKTFPKHKVLSALKSIFKHNVLPFERGMMGAINGSRPLDSSPDYTCPQSDEFWVGVNYGLAATMLYEGLDEMAYQVAYGAYHTCWERYGLAFQTPEAYFIDRKFRSLGYMRALTIWAMHFALKSRNAMCNTEYPGIN